VAFYPDRVTLPSPRAHPRPYNRQTGLKGGRRREHPASVQTASRASARERLLAAATSSSTRKASRRSASERIIERAGVAKASLYNLFGSKEELVGRLPGLATRPNDQQASEAIDRFDDPRQKILAVFDAQAKLFEQPTSTAAPLRRPPPKPRPAAVLRTPPMIPSLDPPHVHEISLSKPAPRCHKPRPSASSHIRRRRTRRPHGSPRSWNCAVSPGCRSGAAGRRH